MLGCRRSQVMKARLTENDVEGSVVVGIGEAKSDVEETDPRVEVVRSAVTVTAAAEIGDRGDCHWRRDAHSPPAHGAYR